MPDSWMTDEERSWVKSLRRVAKAMPPHLELFIIGGGGGGSAVVFRPSEMKNEKSWHKDVMIPRDRSAEVMFSGAVDGGDPDWYDYEGDGQDACGMSEKATLSATIQAPPQPEQKPGRQQSRPRGGWGDH